MSYALVENGVVTQVGLPQTGTLQDGSTVSGYNLLDVEILLDEGWLPFVDTVPANTSTEIFVADGYTVEATSVVQNYKSTPAPTPAQLLAIAQAKKKDELGNAVRAKITSGYQSTITITSTGLTYLYGTEIIDQQNMTASRVWSDNNPTATVKYRPSGGVGRIDHTREEFVAISDKIFDRVNWYLDQVDVYIPQIYATDATVDSVNAIVITIADPVL